MAKTCKYYKQQRQVSYDGGQTWTPLDEYQRGAFIEAESQDCGVVPPTPPVSGNYLIFIAQEDGTFKFSGTTPQGSSVNQVQYSLDSGRTWIELADNTNTPTVQSGKEIWWKGECTPVTYGGIGRFSSTNNFIAKGYPDSLKYNGAIKNYDLYHGNVTTSDYQFYYLFNNCTGLTSAEDLLLPSVTLWTHAYEGMFYGCTSLTKAPRELPANNILGQSCYESMFEGCTSLTTIPTLALEKGTVGSYERTYYAMFKDCTSLTTPMSVLRDAYVGGDYCYAHMFEGCISLTTTPVFHVEKIAFSYCFAYMFKGCTSLTTVPQFQLPEYQETVVLDTGATYCYQSMFEGCTSLTTIPSFYLKTLGTFTTPGGPLEGCFYSMFKGCTSLTTVPDNLFCYYNNLPLSLSRYCFAYIFSGCTSLQRAPELLAETLREGCYYNMFNGCSSLNYIKCLATDISATKCLSNWVNNVAASGTFVKDSSKNWGACGVNKIPCGWTIQNN